ncbi:MAG: hypothetical protein HY722_04115 [Planctomycetes bacterium]|nr:hypothetical protein [Planctomycetota bacterium]
MPDYYSFEEVLTELAIDKEELMKLVSQGELRGFRDGMSMKFKKDDVLNLKKGRETEPTIILTDSDQALGVPESSDELLLDESGVDETVLNVDDVAADAGRTSRAGASTSVEEASDEISFDSTEDFSLTAAEEEDSEVVIPTVEVPAIDDEEMDLSAATVVAEEQGETLVDVGGSPTMETESFELVDEEEPQAESVSPSGRASGRAPRSARVRAMQLQQKASHTLWTVFLLLAAVVLIFPGAIYLNAVKGIEPEWVQGFSRTFRGIVDSVYSMFAG